MDKCDFCGLETPEVDYVIDEEDTDKAETCYDMFLVVEVVIQGDGDNE